jgi:hypothetical protein
MDDDKRLAIQEAKSFSSYYSNGISKIRQRAWNLGIFSVAICVYISQMDKPNILSLVICSILVVALIITLWVFFIPVGMSIEGIDPAKSKEKLRDKEYDYGNCVLDTYSDIIEENREIHSKLRKYYIASVIVFTLIFCVAIYTKVHEFISCS